VCDYAANVEAVTTPVPPSQDFNGLPVVHEESTPDAASIEALVSYSNSDESLRRADREWVGADTLKVVVFMLTETDGTQRPLAIGLPGDREVDAKRLEAVLHPREARPFEEADFAKYPALVKGYIGPGVLGKSKPACIEFLVDPRVVDGTSWVSGANAADRHAYDLVVGRDFSPDGTIEVAEVREGDLCPECKGCLTLARGIEIGHIFQLGRKYAEAMGLKVQAENGELVTVTMGSYGIGVSRAVAAIAEQSHDDKGLIWPREVAPADVHLIATGKSDEPFDYADQLALDLQAQGIRVLLDDRRGVSPGVKFNDSELIGVPTIVVVGKRLPEGFIEVKDRSTGERTDIAINDAASQISALCRS